MMVRGEVAVAGALGAAGDGAAGCVDGGVNASGVIHPGTMDGMGEPSPGCGASVGTNSVGDVGDVPADGAACGGVTEGDVGDVPGVGVVGDADGEGVVCDAPVLSAAGDAFSDGEGAAGVFTAGGAAGDDNSEGVAGDSSGREFMHGWSSAVLGVGPRHSWRRGCWALEVGWSAGPCGVGCFWCLGMSSPMVARLLMVGVV